MMGLRVLDLGPKFERRESIPGGLTALPPVLRFLSSQRDPLCLRINTGVPTRAFFAFPLIRIDPFAFATFAWGQLAKHTGPDGSFGYFGSGFLCVAGKHAFSSRGSDFETAEPFITANGRGGSDLEVSRPFCKAR